MVSRWDTTNPFQAHHDMLNTFQVYASLNLDPNSIQVVLLDTRYPDGPFNLAWSRIFLGGKRVVDIRELLRFAARGSPSKTICIRKAIWGVHGGISPLSFQAHKVQHVFHPRSCIALESSCWIVFDFRFNHVHLILLWLVIIYTISYLVMPGRLRLR